MKTLVNFILDKSGSMETVKQSTINGFNEYIQELRRKECDYSFTLTLFDTSVQSIYTNAPLSEVRELSAETYKPDGGTALYDAVCETVERVERTMTPDQKSLVIIMTDGEENASTKFKMDQVKFLIEHLQRTEKWSFVFLGANQDSWMKAKDFGIHTYNTSNFNATGKGVNQVFHTVAANTEFFAMSAQNSTANFFTKKDQEEIENTK